MSVIAWIAAVSEPRAVPARPRVPSLRPLRTSGRSVPESPLDRNPDLWLYRDRTVALLHRYLRYSLETGRLPSLLGCDFFRTAVTSYTVTTFEDRVVFVHDMEICLERLNDFSRQIIARVVLQEHSHEAAARLLHCSRRTIERNLLSTLDRLSEIFLEVGLLTPAPSIEEVR
jgi:DNA-directed RNA polymerase specialized sigma24 family protein